MVKITFWNPHLSLQIYETVLFFYGASKPDFDARWKSLHSVKEALEDKVSPSQRGFPGDWNSQVLHR